MDKTEDFYKSIAKDTEAELKEKGSKFIAYLFPVQTPTAFDARLEVLRSLHHKANHLCYAYRLVEEDKYRFNDDGEPSGTAGRPILNQLKSANLKNTACVVVRYFGGTKLGTSGLISAYKEATVAAIAQADIAECYIEESLRVSFDYSIMGNLMDAIKSMDYVIAETSFDSKPSLLLKIRRSCLKEAPARIMARLLGRSVEDIDETTKVDGLRFEQTETGKQS